ncbi:MAG: signal peptidase II, partial [Pseudomonadota bacterium]
PGVVDFIDLYWKNWHWPAFNLADIAICLGAIGILIGNFCSTSTDTH